MYSNAQMHLRVAIYTAIVFALYGLTLKRLTEKTFLQLALNSYRYLLLATELIASNEKIHCQAIKRLYRHVNGEN